MLPRQALNGFGARHSSLSIIFKPGNPCTILPLRPHSSSQTFKNRTETQYLENISTVEMSTNTVLTSKFLHLELKAFAITPNLPVPTQFPLFFYVDPLPINALVLKHVTSKQYASMLLSLLLLCLQHALSASLALLSDSAGHALSLELGQRASSPLRQHPL